ncbi:MAG: hypothetical protein M0R46_06275 [Candidatus Muirbacterium halophilum]|nr:hypothetical protein [Candidatus Muirbacterium halophilum]
MVQLSTVIEVDSFILFLKDNNAYDEYVFYCQMDILDIINSLLYMKDINFVGGAFYWQKSSTINWLDINEKWLRQKDYYYVQYKRDKLLRKIL